VEGLRADARLPAEGITTLLERVDRVETDLREEVLCGQRELSAMLRFSSVPHVRVPLTPPDSPLPSGRFGRGWDIIDGY